MCNNYVLCNTAACSRCSSIQPQEIIYQLRRAETGLIRVYKKSVLVQVFVLYPTAMLTSLADRTQHNFKAVAHHQRMDSSLANISLMNMFYGDVLKIIKWVTLFSCNLYLVLIITIRHKDFSIRVPVSSGGKSMIQFPSPRGESCRGA